MEFDKNNKVKLETLNAAEAGIYIDFLDDEIVRHITEITKANARIRFWGSAKTRHGGDIASAYERIDKVKQKFNIS